MRLRACWPSFCVVLGFVADDQPVAQEHLGQRSPPVALFATGNHFLTGGVLLATMQQPLAMASIKLQLKMKGTVQYTCTQLR